MLEQKKIVCSIATSFILVNHIYAKDIKEFGTLTVTAQKVEENIQQVPISITAFDEFTIEDRKIESVQDIAPYTSNFVLIDKMAGYFTPSIRGVSHSLGYSLSNPVSVIIDGIPVSNANGFNETLMDIERIEILKGPQVTLYGKDAQAGAINIITKKPNNETDIKIKGDIGSDNKREYSLSASGPIVKDKLFVGLSAKHYEKDGFIKNTTLGGYTNDKENDYGRVYLRYTPSDNLEVSLISSKLKKNDGDTDFIVTTNPNEKSIDSNIKGYDKSTTTAHALKVSYNINDYLLESISTFRNHKTKGLQNFHFPPSMDFHLGVDRDHDKLSQEFRISSQRDSLQWLIGVYADKDQLDEVSNYFYPSFIYPLFQKQESDSLGVFFHTDYKINNKLSLILGARYDRDNKGFEDLASNTKLNLSDNEVSPKVSLKYQQNQNSMYYATISKGYRAGGFHPYAPNGYSKQYDRETLLNYEVGVKNSFFDNKLIVNSSIFYMDIDDMQVKIYPDPNSFKSIITNAAKATSKGFELELNAKATDSLELFGSYGYTDATFDEYKDIKGDYSGNTNIYAPKYNYNLGVQYRDNQGYFARVDLNGYGKTYFNKENTNSKDSYNLVNAKVGYETEDYDIYLYGKNIFNKEYNSINLFNSGGVAYSPPREIGVQLAYRF